MMPADRKLFNLSTMDTWQLRADAATEGHWLTLEEIGRVLLHLNQRRGYKHAKSDESDSAQKSNVAEVNKRYATLKEEQMTAGQHFASALKRSEQTSSKGKHVYDFRIKGLVLPRKAYEDEFYKIMSVQRCYYPEILTDETIQRLHDIIFYQRPLKSCKRLVSICEFESLKFINKDNGKEVITGPKVSPRTSPLAQHVRLWEAVNNIRLKNYSNKRKKSGPSLPGIYDESVSDLQQYRLTQFEYTLTQDERSRVFDYLNTHEKMTQTDLLKILGLKSADGFRWEGAPKNGLEGNRTYTQLKATLDHLEQPERLLRFNIEYEDTDMVDQETGEIIPRVKMCTKSAPDGTPKSTYPQYHDEPLHKLWHAVYSSSTREELEKAMAKVFSITDRETIDNLFKIDFVKAGYANRSAKFMRKLLPYLKDGHVYSEACTFVGVNHSDSLTNEQNLQRPLKDRLDNLAKGSLRQPLVEKILNQMINIVNALLEKYGPIDEIRVELARELKQSKEQRAKATVDIAKREKDNEVIALKIKEQGLVPSRRNIQKYRLWEETGERCIYCGKVMGIAEFLGGHGGEIEHIIPRSMLFDDSMSNKTCSCRDCNQDKGNKTAYDYMQTRSEDDFNRYLARVDDLYRNKNISRTKHSRLLMTQNEIPQDFLDRDLRQSQYISKKAREILMEVCRNVNASSGSVTDFLRHIWGYDMILHNLNIERYSRADLVEETLVQHHDQTRKELRIKEWSKRLDHRHHAIDALVIALTRQGYVQKLSNLCSQHAEIYADLKKRMENDPDGRFHLVEKWAEHLPHFSVAKVAESVDSIAVSIKSGKKLFTPGKRYIYRSGGRRRLVQDGLIVPRGALHEDTLYGKIKLLDKGKDLKYAFANPDTIIDPNIKDAVKRKLEESDSDVKKAIKSLKKRPLILDGATDPITSIDCYNEAFASRADIATLSLPSIQRIVDPAIREAALERFNESGNKTKYKQSFKDRPIMTGGDIRMPVKMVRVMDNHELVAVRRDKSGRPVAYAAEGSNHHAAFYEKDGKRTEIVVSAWVAMKRKLLGLPVVIMDADCAWQRLMNLPESDDVRKVADSLPPAGSRYVRSFKMGDMCLLGLSPEQLSDAIAQNDKRTLAAHLYRVQSISLRDYVFRLHTWTSVGIGNDKQDMDMKAMYRIRSYKSLKENFYTTVKIDNLGNIKIIE